MPTALRCLILGFVMLAASARNVAAQEAVTTHPAINRFCPVMTEEEAKPEFTTTYQGRTVAFCCAKCLAKFEANPQRYASRLAELGESTDSHTAATDEAEEAVGSGQDNSPEVKGHTKEPELGQEVERRSERAQRDEHDEARGLARFIAWLGKFHPAMVHFPIGLLLGAAVAELLLIAAGRTLFAHAARFCLWFGTISALLAAMLGWFFGGFHWTDESLVLTTHRWLGTATAAWAVFTTVAAGRARRLETSRNQAVYRAALFFGAALVAATGFFGGALIYGLDHYAW